MKKDKYIGELNSITASEDFKESTKQVLLQELRKNNKKKDKSSGSRKVPWVAVASVCILVSGAVLLSSLFHNDGHKDAEKTLPLLTVSEEQHMVGAHGGGEVLILQDIEELTRGNPWHEEANLDTLPVFQNKAPRDGAGMPQEGLSQEEIQAKAEKIASQLDKSIQGKEEQDFGLTAELGEYQLMIEKTGAVEVRFSEPRTIYELEGLQRETERKDYEKVLANLLEEYAAFVGLEEPGHDIWYDYDLEGEKNWRITAFDNFGNLEERIVGYHFNSLDFVFNHKQQLYIIRKFAPEKGETLGDYPIITPEKAEQLLLRGDYHTTVPETTPEEGEIKKVELVYDTSGFEKYFMPYYKFYVAIPKEEIFGQTKLEEDFYGFGVYYVPAVEKGYLETN